MIEVVAGILRSADKVLIAKRGNNKDLAGFWEFPGGKIETDESPEEALIREFKEEFDVELRVQEEFHQNIFEYPSKTIQLKSYFAESSSENFTLKEHEKVEWVAINELDNYQISPADIPIVQKLQAQTSIKRAYYSNYISEFLNTSLDEISGKLSNNHSNRSLEDLQRNAWAKQIEILQKTLQGLSGKIYFEFAIPRMGKRVDNILLIKDCVFVIEFKVGETTFNKNDQSQVLDYSLDLTNFHEGSHNAKLVPILVSTNASSATPYNKEAVLELSEVVKVGTEDLKSVLLDFINKDANDVDALAWENSIYKPTPTIVEAAQALYKGHNVKEISRSDSGAINLSKTSNCLSRIIEETKKNHRKSICFVTGVPGAGKTLAGLNIANQRMKADEDEHAVFLSGNGPLVDVLREALARDVVLTSKTEGQPITKENAKRRTNAFIQNIHHFRDEYLKFNVEPTEKVVVFDEAQRAWNKKQVSSFMKRKRGDDSFNMSEPEFLIEVMNRHSDWCTVICLIGGGQEINTGEAGLEEWVNSFKTRFKSWDIYFSDQIISNENYLKSDELREWLPAYGNKETELHLAVSVRSFRSEKLSAFVHSLLELETEKAKELYGQIKNDFPIVITRDLDTAKKWIRDQKRGTERTGIIASSGARRLKAIGIDVKNEISAPNWFLNTEDDVRSSYFLEEIATEFDIQGLEIDYTCVAWGGNFHLRGGQWNYQNFKGTKWQNIKQDIDKEYLKNTYRVLLTRARQGMVIYVPEGSDIDQTRPRIIYDFTFEYFKEIGLLDLDAET